MIKKYIAETIGTFTLALVVGLSLAGIVPIATPLLAALTLGLFVYSIGYISGVHINPAVTIGVWSINKINTNDAASYIVAQFIGAALALMLLSATVSIPTLALSVSWQTIVAEILGTLLFTFGIASVIYGKTPSLLSGAVIGGSLLLGIMIAVLMGSNGVLNPAVALSIGSFSLVYAIAPIIGSVAGMHLYKYLSH